MAILLDGFEQFSQTDRAAQYMRLAGYTVGDVTLVGGRKGGNAVSMYRSSMRRAFAFTGQQLTVGFAMRFDKRGPIFGVQLSGQSVYQLAFRVDKDTGLIVINGVSGYIAPLPNRWYYFELEMNKAAGTAQLYVNGRPDVAAPLPGTLAGDITLVFNPFDVVQDDFGTRLLDDLYITDALRLGPLQVTTRFPTTALKTDWQNAGGSNIAAVSPPIDTLDKYIFTGVPDAEDQYKSSTALPDNSPLRFVQLMTLYRKATSDPLSLEVNLDDQRVTISNLPRDWAFSYTPMSAAGYDSTSIVDAQFGVKLKV